MSTVQRCPSPVLMVDEVMPELGALLGSAWTSPDVHCQTAGCDRPAMLALDLLVQVSPFETRSQTVLCCEQLSCWRTWRWLADAEGRDVHPLTPQVAAEVTGLDLGGADETGAVAS